MNCRTILRMQFPGVNECSYEVVAVFTTDGGVDRLDSDSG